MARKTEEGLAEANQEGIAVYVFTSQSAYRRTSPIERLINSGQELALAGGRLIAAPSRIA
jgi:hypothetical protein